MESIESVLGLHSAKKLSDSEAIERIKAINTQLLENALDVDGVVGIPHEHNYRMRSKLIHLMENKLKHWRHG